VGRRPLDEFEAEIRDTRRRLAALLASADRHFGLRAGLNGLRHLSAKPTGDGGDPEGLWRALAIPAAILAFFVGLAGAGRSHRPAGPADPHAKTDC
jgi:hypothetical protein